MSDKYWPVYLRPTTLIVSPEAYAKVVSMFPTDHEDTCVCDECMEAYIDRAFEDPEKTPKISSSCPPPSPPDHGACPVVPKSTPQPAEYTTVEKAKVKLGFYSCYYCGGNPTKIVGKVASSGAYICEDCHKNLL